MKALIEAEADVDKESKNAWTALLYAVKKMGNLISEKRTRCMCEGIALLAVTLCTRYRYILLLPLSLLIYPKCVGDALSVLTLRSRYRRILLFPPPPPHYPNVLAMHL